VKKRDTSLGLILLSALSGLFSPSLLTSQPSMPLNLAFVQAEEPGETPYYHWRSARNFEGPPGVWHLDQLPALTQGFISDFVAAEKGHVKLPCIAVKEPTVDPVPGRSIGPWTFSGAVSESVSVVSGEVAAMDNGFIDGRPALLLGIEVEDHLKRFRPDHAPVSIYVAYPKADFSVGRYRFCRDANDDFPPAPAIGTRVLLISLDGPTEDTEDLFQMVVTGADLYWQPAGRSLIVSTGKLQLKPGELSGTKSVEDLLTLTAGLVSGGR